MTPPFPAIEDLIPHRGTMLLLDRVHRCAGDTTTAEYAPRANAWYADANGNMPAWMGIELMAQTIAAHVGLAHLSRGTAPQLGFLLGTRSYRATAAHFAPGQVLRVEACKVFSDPSGLGAYDCTIEGITQPDPANADEAASDADLPLTPLASATLKVFETHDAAGFLQGQGS